MLEGFVPFGSSSIHYSCWGTGNKLLLCFHGYGESAASFAILEQAMGKDFTILALDLPFHGETQWKEGLYFDPDQLPDLMRKIIASLPLAGDLVSRDAMTFSDRWDILGYSMGGRVALCLLEKIPEKIGKLVLLAPDGLTINGWYWLATQTRPGNRVFRWAMQHPAGFFFLLRIGRKLKWVNPGVYKFISYYIDDPQVRDELYKRWTVMRKCKPGIRTVRSIIREQDIRVSLVYGRHDRIIRAGTGERFRKGIEVQCSLTILDTGHGLLQPRYLEAIAALLTS